MIFFRKKYKHPDVGDFKIKKVFAFLPKNIGNKIVWMEFFEEIYFFEEKQIVFNSGQILKYKCWVKIDTRCRIKIK